MGRLTYCRTKYARLHVEDKFSPYTGWRNPGQSLAEVILDKLTAASVLYVSSRTPEPHCLLSDPNSATWSLCDSSKSLPLFVPPVLYLKGQDTSPTVQGCHEDLLLSVQQVLRTVPGTKRRINASSKPGQK